MKVQVQRLTADEVQGQRVPADSRTGRLLRFRFNPPPLGAVPLRAGGFAARLATSPPDLVTHLGMVRSSAYYAAGCPVELCDHAAARDLWAVIHEDAIAEDGAAVSGRRGAPRSERRGDGGLTP